MQSPESNPDLLPLNGFNPFPDFDAFEDNFPIRSNDDVKLQAADLFSLFTANIIKENVPFTR